MKIKLDFISSETLSNKGSVEKIDIILQRIKQNVIVVLEEGLTPQEKAELIEANMREVGINPEGFQGIEFESIDHKETRLRDRIASYIAGRKTGMMIVGPKRMVEAIKKEPEGISMLAKVEPVKRKKKGEEVAK